MYLEIDEDFPAHPKSVRLGIQLSNPVAWAYVQKLWVFCCKYQKDGNLSSYSPTEIEGFVGWQPGDGRFYTACVAVGFIDEAGGGRAVHNWADRQGRWLAKLDADRRRKANERACVQRTSDGQGADSPRSGARTAPVPNLVLPNLTKPDPTGEEICAELAKPASPPSPAIVIFPTIGLGPREWGFTRAEVDLLLSGYPDLDVIGEARKALVWVQANPSRRKTAKGMRAFLAGWMSRAQNRGHANGAASVTPFPTKQDQTVAAGRRFMDRHEAKT